MPCGSVNDQASDCEDDGGDDGNSMCASEVTYNPACGNAPPPPPPPPQPTSAPSPECFAQLKDRPIDDPGAQKVGAVHTFWWVQGWVQGVSTQFILSAGPQKPTGSTTAYLNAWAVPGNSNGKDNSQQHLDWNSGISGSLCAQVDEMIVAAESFPNNTIRYSPYALGLFGGPNSNSAAHYFGSAGGFNDVTAPLTAYGWNVPTLLP